MKKLIRPNLGDEDNAWDVIPETSQDFEVIDDLVKQLNKPDTNDYIRTQAGYVVMRFWYGHLNTAHVVTNIKIYIYMRGFGLHPPILIHYIKNAYGLSHTTQITYTNQYKWYKAEKTGLFLTQEQFNTCYSEFFNIDSGEPDLRIAAMYMEVDYIPTPNLKLLPKPKKAMLAYNFYCKKYIERKNKELVPYATPDGELQ